MEYRPFDPDFNIKGKVALVTGASKGIGKAIAQIFAQKGADIIMAGQSEEVKIVSEEILKYGVKVLPVTGDISKKEIVESIVRDSIDTFGRIDILVNCAGISLLGNVEDFPEADWDRIMEVNLKGSFMLSKYVGREMIKKNSGKIINMASQAGIIALEKHIAYCASKAAMINMTKVMALEWAKFNINVNAISPTIILTEMGKKAWAGDAGEEMKKKIPAGRFGYPDEVAACALFLASDASNMITGENIVIDGGYTII
jgi:NAD(P)-dependent dehydrogenase (short-subunit alcohol dehydrogenase family)